MQIAPVVTSVTFDQPSYPPGALVTATVKYTPGMSGHNFTGVATDDVTNLTGSMTVQFGVPNPTAASASDDGNHAWVKVSDAGGVAVFTATA